MKRQRPPSAWLVRVQSGRGLLLLGMFLGCVGLRAQTNAPAPVLTASASLNRPAPAPPPPKPVPTPPRVAQSLAAPVVGEWDDKAVQRARSSLVIRPREEPGWGSFLRHPTGKGVLALFTPTRLDSGPRVGAAGRPWVRQADPPLPRMMRNPDTQEALPILSVRCDR